MSKGEDHGLSTGGTLRQGRKPSELSTNLLPIGTDARCAPKAPVSATYTSVRCTSSPFRPAATSLPRNEARPFRQLDDQERMDDDDVLCLATPSLYEIAM